MAEVARPLNPNLNGPESVPLRDFVRAFPIVVTVYNGDDIIRTERIDYGNSEHRKWLGKVTYWACSNHYVVETIAAADHDSQ